MRISYFLGIREPETHFLDVSVTIEGYPEEILQLTMPAWTPGSYTIRDFARNVRNMRARTNGTVLDMSKKDKSTWKVVTGRKSPVTVEYEVYADEAFPQTSHVDASHAFITGTSVFVYLEGYREQTVELTIEKPDGWRISTALDRITDNRYRATNYDILVDSPIEIGTHETLSFRVDGRDHEIALYGDFMGSREKLLQDVSSIVEAAQRIMGQLPYRRYLFIFHAIREFVTPYVGLEHAHSTAINFESGFLEDEKSYKTCLSVISHEFFHLWNVKRIRPTELVEPGFREEVYTHGLWFSEGVTDYYANILILRAGLITTQEFLDKMASEISSYRMTPGRRYYSAAESSFDSWIKYYRSSTGTVNSYVDYYLKGLLLGLMLSTEIINASRGSKSLDDLMRNMMEKYRRDGRGFSEKDLLQALREISGTDMTDWFRMYVKGRDEIPFESMLSSVGLILEKKPLKDGRRSTGLVLRKSGGKFLVSAVHEGTSSYEAGINAGDELVAAGGIRFNEKMTGTPVRERILQDLFQGGGEHVNLHVFRNGRIMEFQVKLPADPFETYALRESEENDERKNSMRAKLLSG